MSRRKYVGTKGVFLTEQIIKNLNAVNVQKQEI